MIAMSTVITVVTATTMQLKINSSSQILMQELYEEIDSNPNYPMISSTPTNQIVNSDQTKDISKKLYSSKLEQLLDHLLLMNTCVSNDRQLPYQTTFSKPHKNQLRNITHFKNIVFFNYLKATNYTS